MIKMLFASEIIADSVESTSARYSHDTFDCLICESYELPVAMVDDFVKEKYAQTNY